MNFFTKLFLLSILIFAACSVQKKVDYELPAEMLPHVKVEYTKRCDKGKILYDINCSRCHTKKEKRKEIIPDWTSLQLSGYTLRVTNAIHEKNMPDSLVTEEELGIIMTFLNYKIKNSAKK
jgi:hypothetical protein